MACGLLLKIMSSVRCTPRCRLPPDHVIGSVDRDSIGSVDPSGTTPLSLGGRSGAPLVDNPGARIASTLITLPPGTAELHTIIGYWFQGLCPAPPPPFHRSPSRRVVVDL